MPFASATQHRRRKGRTTGSFS